MTDKPNESGYEPQGKKTPTGRGRREYIRAEDVLVQMNLSVPQTLKWAIEDYAAENDLSKREALNELIQAGLAQKRLKTKL